MLLAVELALAIILAYLVADSRHAVLKPVRWLAVAVLSLWVAAPTLWVLSAALPAFKPLIVFVVIAAITATAALGAFGLSTLIRRLLPPRLRGSAMLIILLGVANIIFVALFTGQLLAFTPLGPQYARVNLWSHANGFEAGGVLALQAICWLWPYIPLLIRLRRH